MTDRQALTAPIPATYRQGAQSATLTKWPGLLASPFFSAQVQANLQPLYDTAAALRAIVNAPDFVEETREFLIDCIETALGGQVPDTGNEPGAYTHAALRLHCLQAEARLDSQWGQRLVQAARRDVKRPTCASWSDLMLYCRYQAEPLGRAVLELHGLSDPQIERATDALTAALLVLQLVARCGTDWRQHGRCYLPTDWFAEFSGSPENLVERRSNPAVKAVKLRVLDRVDKLLAQASPLPDLLTQPRLRAEAHRLLGHARAQLALLKRRDPLARRLRLPLWKRASIHLFAWMLAKRA